MRRVVVTGLGAVTPVGNTAPETWRAAVAGESGIDWIRAFDADGLPVRVAAEVKDFDPAGLAHPKELRRLDRNVVLALGAAKEALADSGLNGFDPRRVGIVFGSAIGGLIGIVEQADTLRDRGPDRVSPYFIPNVLVDSASGQLAISLGIRGPNYAPVSACATGSHAVGEGAETIRRGDADAILAGGTEACIHPLILAGFTAMRGLAAEDENPPHASRPFDATRAGFVMGEGACVLVLEELESARARGATIYAEVLGYGASNDGHHMAAARARGGRRRRDDARGARARRGRAAARRLHQRPRHLDAARGRGRDEGDQGRLRRPRLRARGLVDQVDDGPLLRGGGRDRGDDVRARGARRRAAADDQLRAPRSRPATSTTCRTRRARPRSTSRSRTRWASAATTRACWSAARLERIGSGCYIQGRGSGGKLEVRLIAATLAALAAAATLGTAGAAPPPGFTLTVTKTGTAAGTVVTTPAGIDCGADCTAVLPERHLRHPQGGRGLPGAVRRLVWRLLGHHQLRALDDRRPRRPGKVQRHWPDRLQGASAARSLAREGEGQARAGELQGREAEPQGLDAEAGGQGRRPAAEAGTKLKKGGKVNLTLGTGPKAKR